MITVTVPSDGADAELATYCAPESDEEKLHPDVCPSNGTVTDTRPLGWFVRVVFNERLIPTTVEDLIPDENGDLVGTLSRTQPVILECGGENVPYDGFYSPSGSHLTASPGPALIVQPLEYVAASTQDCQITVRDVLMDWDYQRITRRGPYAFGIAPIRVVSTSPESCATGVASLPELQVRFNALIDAASLGEAIELAALDAGEPLDLEIAVHGNGQAAIVQPVDALAEDTTYVLRVSAGVRDIKGGVLAMDAPLETFFATGAAISAEPCDSSN